MLFSINMARAESNIPFLPQVWALSELNGELLDADFSKDDIKVVTASGNNKIQIWRTTTGTLDMELALPNGYKAGKVLYSPNSKLLAVSNTKDEKGQFVFLINTETAEVFQTLQVSSTEANLKEVMFNEMGDQLFTAVNNSIAIWNVNTGNVISKFSLEQETVALAYLAKSNQLAVALANGSINIRNAENGQYMYEIVNEPKESAIREIKYNRSNQLVFDLNGGPSLYVRGESELKSNTKSTLTLADSQMNWHTMAVHPQGRFIAGAFKQQSAHYGYINILDIFTGDVVAKASTQTNLLRFNTSGTRLLAGNVLYDTSKLQEKIQTGITAEVVSDIIKVGERVEVAVYKLYNNQEKVALNTGYTISSSNPNVVGLSFGKMEAKAEGKATLTVTAGNHKTSIDITVNNYKENVEQINIDPRKIWTINFNDNVDLASLSANNIYVTDKDGKKVGVNYSVDQNKVKVTPVSDYKSGGTYTLWVRDVKSVSGKVIQNYSSLRFTIR